MSTTSEGSLGLTIGGGCAAKFPAKRLEELLKGFVPVDSDDLLVGLAPADDAAVYRLDDERAIVFTIDFFPPMVDDPEAFGAIAATNALNDVFAMGATPLLALSVAAFPEEMANEQVAAVFGAADAKVREAGAILAGGHTIRDVEVKYGLAVVGTASPAAIWRKSSAAAGDVLLLTKPLGTGIVLAAANQGEIDPGFRDGAIEQMRQLNAAAVEIIRPCEPSAATDVTGFGLFGHAMEMAERSEVRIAIDAASMPPMPGALEAAAGGIRTGGDSRNRDLVAGRVDTDGLDETLDILGHDPQTAGGLLVAVDPSRAAVLQATLEAEGLFCARIGQVEAGSGVVVR
jgi:selenide,water dikinase